MEVALAAASAFVFLTWHLYALLAVGYAGMTLSEIALQTGVLAPAIATFSILDAVTSVVLGSRCSRRACATTHSESCSTSAPSA